MKPKAGGKHSNEHEQVYHAVARCQAASLPLTLRHLHDQKKTCSIEGKKTGGFAFQRKRLLSSPGSMVLASSFKGSPSVGLRLLPHRKENAHPDICKGAQSHTVTFTLLAFAVVVIPGPASCCVLCQANW